jgi:hypothetical protein
MDTSTVSVSKIAVPPVAVLPTPVGRILHYADLPRHEKGNSRQNSRPSPLCRSKPGRFAGDSLFAHQRTAIDNPTSLLEIRS